MPALSIIACASVRSASIAARRASHISALQLFYQPCAIRSCNVRKESMNEAQVIQNAED